MEYVDKIKISIFFFLFLINLKLNAQDKDSTYNAPFLTKNKYMKYLFFADNNTKASIMNISYRFLYIPRSTAFSAKGMHLTVGLILARFFTRQIIFGICYDLKQFSGFTKQNLSQSFIDDFNSNFISTYGNEKDSSRAQTLRDAINNSQGAGIHGNAFENFGISFSPFPLKYGGFLIEVKKGNRIFPIFGDYTKKHLSRDDGSYIYLQLNNSYSVELSFKPYRFYNSERIVAEKSKLKDLYKFIVISFYYEKLTFKNATFNSVSLDQIVSQNFISQYSNINTWGIKIGMAIY